MVRSTGTAPVINAMLAGEIDYECDPGAWTVAGYVRSALFGTAQGTRVTAACCSAMLPDVPTSYEQGLPESRLLGFLCGDTSQRHATTHLVEKGSQRPLNKGLNEEACKNALPILHSADPSRNQVAVDRKFWPNR